MATITVRSYCPPCGKLAKSNCIACDACNRWFHASCVGLAAKEYKKFVDDSTLEWKCLREDCTEQHNLDFVVNTVKELSAVKKNLEGECSKLKEELERTRQEIEDLSQYVRRNNLLISGIPETPDEDTNQIIINIAHKLGITMEQRDLDITHRLPTKVRGTSRPLLVKFNNRWLKHGILNAAISKKPKSDFFGFDIRDSKGNPIPIYFNDHQTKLNASIAKRVRDLKREEKISGYRVRNGVVSVKVRQDDEYQIVNTIEKLNTLKKVDE